MKWALTNLVILVLAIGGWMSQHQERQRLEATISALQAEAERLSALATQNAELDERLAVATNSPPLVSEEHRELLQLRREVSSLRVRTYDLEGLRQDHYFLSACLQSSETGEALQLKGRSPHAPDWSTRARAQDVKRERGEPSVSLLLERTVISDEAVGITLASSEVPESGFVLRRSVGGWKAGGE